MTLSSYTLGPQKKKYKWMTRPKKKSQVQECVQFVRRRGEEDEVWMEFRYQGSPAPPVTQTGASLSLKQIHFHVTPSSSKRTHTHLHLRPDLKHTDSQSSWEERRRDKSDAGALIFYADRKQSSRCQRLIRWMETAKCDCSDTVHKQE